MSAEVLRAGAASAAVSPRGAELVAWAVDGRDLLWAGDPASWPDRAPILFPVVGWTRGGRIRVGGASFPLGVHGFARELPFAMVERTDDRIALRAASTPGTRACFPFDWTLTLTYALAPSRLAVELAVTNTGPAAMPYACGLHPGFRWPFAGGVPEDYHVLFDEAERPRVPVIAPDGLFTDRTRPVPLDGTRLPLTPALMAAEALCFLDARSRGLAFVHASGAAIRVAVEDFPHLALWSRPPGRFLCLEAWTGHGDRVDADGDLFAKPSMRHLAPGASGRHRAWFSYGEAKDLCRAAGLAGQGKAET